MRQWSLGGLALALVIAWPRPGVADGTGTGIGTGTPTDANLSVPATSSREAVLRRARQHFEDGRKAFDAKDYPSALREFRAGYELEPRPGFLLNMAHSTQKIGDLPAARDLYTRFLQTNPTGEERRVAEEAIAEIDRKLAAGPGAVGAPAEGAAAGTATSPPGAAAVGTATTSSVASGPAGGPAKSPATTGAAKAPGSSTTPGGLPVLPDVGTPPSDSTMLRAPGTQPPEASSSENSPLYTKWWLWTGVGLVAVGVAAFLVFGAKGSSSGHDTGTWGQIKL
jgi:hypothetical protein